MRQLALAGLFMVAVAFACGPKSNDGTGPAIPPSTPCMRDADCGKDMRCNTCPTDPACPDCDVCGMAICEPVR
jgi:hypothetical protein